MKRAQYGAGLVGVAMVTAGPGVTNCVTAMANALYDQSQLYTRQKLNDSEKQRIFCDRAVEALKTLPESKETKALITKIEGSLKRPKL